MRRARQSDVLHAKTLLLAPQRAASKLARLKRRQLIKGDPESLVDVKAAKSRELRNLK